MEFPGYAELISKRALYQDIVNQTNGDQGKPETCNDGICYLLRWLSGVNGMLLPAESLQGSIYLGVVGFTTHTLLLRWNYPTTSHINWW